MKSLKFLIISFFVFTLIGCETDLNVKAPYKRIPVIYSLLDQNDEYHFVKISKLFNGDLDAYEMAAVADSSKVDIKEIYIEEYLNDNYVKTYSLRDTLITNKESGVFASPNQTIYYFKDANLNSESTFKLVVDIGAEEIASATTSLIKNTSVFQDVSWQRFRTTQQISFAANADLTELQLNVVPPTLAKQTEVNMYFTYCTNFTDGTTDLDTIKYQIGSKTVVNPASPAELKFSLDEAVFYQKILEDIPDADDTPNFSNRVAGVVFFDVVNAGEDLYYYMEVNSPEAAVFQARPPFTNVENGLGIFSARTTFNTIDDFPGGKDGFNLNKESLKVLIEGEFALKNEDEQKQVEGIANKGFIEGVVCN